MNFTDTALLGAVLVDLELRVDERGFFARSWCADEFASAGLPNVLVQASVSWNRRRHTLRGMHWQAEPFGEGKLVRCTRGAVVDVIVDLRPGSRTYLDHLMVELSEANHRALYIPPGLAHGYLTHVDDTEVLYQMDMAYVPDAAQGARWDDPAFGIPWPATPAVISERDRSYPDLVLASGPPRSAR